MVVAALAVGPAPLWSQVDIDVQTKGGAKVGGGQQGTTEQDAQGPSTGASVSSAQTMRLQQALKDKGHDPGPINGQMNAQTRAALKSYQQQQGLRATGTLDAETQASLGIGRPSSPGSSAPRSGVAPGTSPVPGKPSLPPEIPATGGAKGGASGSAGGGAGSR
jgi:peptidoglycan hydrolase-like protein with peptidoglycan-binding domain